MVRRFILSWLVVSMLTVGAFIALVPPAESAGDYLVMSEDFDDGMDLDWNATDHNSDSGLDYWGTTGYKQHDGSGSAWCARYGSSSVNYYSNSYNHYYDQDMQAVLQTSVQDLSGYDTVTLTFYYWAETGTTYLDDYLEVRTWNGWYWNRIWKQPDVDTGGSWDQITLALSLDTIWISFSFISNDVIEDVIGFGPYEGVYIDTITVYGYDETPPTSSMTPLDEYSSSETVYITYTAVDRGGSGVSHVELYYRAHGNASYEMYTTEDTVDGKWTDGIIPFNCSLANGVGGYDFYTLAEDMMGNREVPPEGPQTSTVIDVRAPTTTVDVDDGMLPEGWINSSAAIELDASDDISGVAATRYRIDSGPWEDYDGAIEVSEDGEHTISYYSEDNAGNIEGVQFVEFAMDTEAPIAGISPDESDTVFTDSTVSFSWWSDDELSGIDYCIFKVDDRAFEFLGDPEGIVEAVHLASGNHTATLIAFDGAGNSCEATCTFDVDLGASEVAAETHDEILGWSIAIAVIIAAIVAALLLMRSNREETE